MASKTFLYSWIALCVSIIVDFACIDFRAYQKPITPWQWFRRRRSIRGGNFNPLTRLAENRLALDLFLGRFLSYHSVLHCQACQWIKRVSTIAMSMLFSMTIAMMMMMMIGAHQCKMRLLTRTLSHTTTREDVLHCARMCCHCLTRGIALMPTLQITVESHTTDNSVTEFNHFERWSTII